MVRFEYSLYIRYLTQSQRIYAQDDYNPGWINTDECIMVDRLYFLLRKLENMYE